MSLRVLQLGPYPPPEGGISRNMLTIRDELLARGHSCSIIATSASSRMESEPDVYHPRSIFALLKLLSSLKYDVLHLHIGGDVSQRVLALAFACSFFARKKNFLTLHSGAFPLTDKARKATPNSLRGFIFQRFSTLIAVNEAIAEVFRRYGVPADLIRVILPFSLHRPDENVIVPNDLVTFCKKHSPVLLAVGGLERDYDPLFQINAMKQILEKFPNAGLMIVGDGSLRIEVETAIVDSSYAENIFLTGNIEHAVTLHLINKADIMLRTTLFDGDAISVREALFLGTPVIATDTAVRPDGVNLIPVSDKSALVDVMKAVANSERKEKYQSHAENQNIFDIVNLYEEIAKPK
ncbi:MAG: glycosyltransferase family 4 protein [Pyrinomonadaceae bacterium]